MACIRFDPPAISNYYLLEEAYQAAMRSTTAAQIQLHHTVFRGMLFQIMLEEDPAPYKLSWAFADTTARPVVDRLRANPTQQAVEQLKQVLTNAYDSLPAQVG